MLQIKGICKKYVTGELIQTALDNVSLNFRDNEFVAVLGPSGSGKTTLLNIIGGLDRYDSGDLIISNISTKKYKDRDWDAYRNHTIGFVFQSYNLIPHQSILSNVELAMTISGISKKERRRRAKEALQKVGLGDQIHKRPNQMSGGQMQRVAIARALVNNPDILLADEPTGALDSETSNQVIDLLKEVANDRLVIMVTHNRELAEQYATRIVQLRDGKIIGDSMPFAVEESQEELPKHKRMKKTSMSFFTALALSLNNLRTKKTRTILTAFAGSIGIIGIALILSLSSGISAYITQVQKDTLSSYPISITDEGVDLTSLASSLHKNKGDQVTHDLDKVYSSNVVQDLVTNLSKEIQSNDLGAFKTYLDSGKSDIKNHVSDIQYGYNLNLQVYTTDTADGAVQLNPGKTTAELMGMPEGSMGPGGSGNIFASQFSSGVYEELLGNHELLSAQYDVLAGRWPDDGSYNEVVVVLDKNNEISDMALYSMGLLDRKTYEDNIKAIRNGKTVDNSQSAFSYDQILGTTFKLLLNTDYYAYDKNTGTWKSMQSDSDYMTNAVNNAQTLKVVGIVRPNPEASATAFSGVVGYTSALTDHVINAINDTEIAKAQKSDPKTNVFTGMPFDMDSRLDNLTMDDVNQYLSTLPQEERAQYQRLMGSMPEEQILKVFRQRMATDLGDQPTYEDNLKTLGICDLSSPSQINIYCKDFAAKDKVSGIIDQYNKDNTANGHEELTITYTDLVGLIMSSVTDIINMISYVLVGFVSISLVVSSIMIGIITYISVLERTKEIGILRSIGASKRNISGIFNAETLIVGFCAGAIGIGLTLLMLIPTNMIIERLSGVANIATLPWQYGIVLMIISMILTLIAGLIPSRLAAKKDPVTALRSE